MEYLRYSVHLCRAAELTRAWRALRQRHSPEGPSNLISLQNNVCPVDIVAYC